MRRNTTQLRNFKPGKPKKQGVGTNRRRNATSLANNYELILQIYFINKRELTKKKELKCEKRPFDKSIPATSKPSYSIPAMIVSFLTETLLLLKKVRPGVVMVSE